MMIMPVTVVPAGPARGTPSPSRPLPGGRSRQRASEQLFEWTTNLNLLRGPLSGTECERLEYAPVAPRSRTTAAGDGAGAAVHLLCVVRCDSARGGALTWPRRHHSNHSLPLLPSIR
jgi:hypothetical protein